MPYYNKEQISQAREMDLLTYLQRYEPNELVVKAEKIGESAVRDAIKRGLRNIEKFLQKYL